MGRDTRWAEKGRLSHRVCLARLPPLAAAGPLRTGQAAGPIAGNVTDTVTDSDTLAAARCVLPRAGQTQGPGRLERGHTDTSAAARGPGREWSTESGQPEFSRLTVSGKWDLRVIVSAASHCCRLRRKRRDSSH